MTISKKDNTKDRESYVEKPRSRNDKGGKLREKNHFNVMTKKETTWKASTTGQKCQMIRHDSYQETVQDSNSIKSSYEFLL